MSVMTRGRKDLSLLGTRYPAVAVPKIAEGIKTSAYERPREVTRRRYETKLVAQKVEAPSSEAVG